MDNLTNTTGRLYNALQNSTSETQNVFRDNVGLDVNNRNSFTIDAILNKGNVVDNFNELIKELKNNSKDIPVSVNTENAQQVLEAVAKAFENTKLEGTKTFETLKIVMAQCLNAIVDTSDNMETHFKNALSTMKEGVGENEREFKEILNIFDALDDSIKNFSSNVKKSFSDITRTANDFYKEMEKLSQRKFKFDLEIDNLPVDEISNEIKELQNLFNKAQKGITEQIKTDLNNGLNSLDTDINKMMQTYTTGAATSLHMESLFLGSKKFNDYTNALSIQIKELTDEFNNIPDDDSNKEKVKVQIDNLTKTLDAINEKTAEVINDANSKAAQALKILSQGKIQGNITSTIDNSTQRNANLINTHGLNSYNTSALNQVSTLANSSSRLVGMAGARGGVSQQLITDAQRFNEMSKNIAFFTQDLKNAHESGDASDVIKQLTTKNSRAHTVLNNSKISNEVINMAKMTKEQVANNPLLQEQKKIAQQEIDTRKQVIQAIVGELVMLQNMDITDEEKDALNTTIKNLRGEFKQLEQTTEQINNNSSSSLESAFTNAEKAVDSFFKEVDTNNPKLGTAFRQALSTLSQYTDGIAKLYNDLPSGNTAGWLESSGFSGDLAGFTNGVMDSWLGSTVTGALDKAFGTNLSGMDFIDSDMNGRVIKAMQDPESLWKNIGVSGVTQSEIESKAISYAKQEESQIYDALKTAVNRGYSDSVSSLKSFVVDEANELYELSGGKIGFEELSNNYSTFSKAGARSSEDAKLFAEYAALAEETQGLDVSSVQSMMQTYYVDLGMSVDETVGAMERMNKLALTSGVPLSELTKALASVADKYRSIGMSADLAEGTLTNLINMGFSVKDAQDIASTTGSALQSFSNKTGDVIMGGMLSGYSSDPFQMLFDSQHVTASGDGWAKTMANSMDSMLNMTSSIFGKDSYIGGYQIMKQLQGYGYTQKQASQIYDKMQTSDIDGVADLLSTMKTSDEIAEDTNEVINSMKGTLETLGENVGTITKQQVKADMTAKKETNTVENLAETLSGEIGKVLDKNVEAMRIDYDALDKSINDGALRNVLDNLKENDIMNDILEAIKGIANSMVFVNMLNLLSGAVSLITTIAGKIVGGAAKGIGKLLGGGTGTGTEAVAGEMIDEFVLTHAPKLFVNGGGLSLSGIFASAIPGMIAGGAAAYGTHKLLDSNFDNKFYSNYNSGDNLLLSGQATAHNEEKKWRDTGQFLGATGGVATGALAGAAIGSIIPGVGTVIGAGVGGIIGGVAGGISGTLYGNDRGGELYNQYGTNKNTWSDQQQTFAVSDIMTNLTGKYMKSGLDQFGAGFSKNMASAILELKDHDSDLYKSMSSEQLDKFGVYAAQQIAQGNENIDNIISSFKNNQDENLDEISKLLKNEGIKISNTGDISTGLNTKDNIEQSEKISETTSTMLKEMLTSSTFGINKSWSDLTSNSKFKSLAEDEDFVQLMNSYRVGNVIDVESLIQDFNDGSSDARAVYNKLFEVADGLNISERSEEFNDALNHMSQALRQAQTILEEQEKEEAQKEYEAQEDKYFSNIQQVQADRKQITDQYDSQLEEVRRSAEALGDDVYAKVINEDGTMKTLYKRGQGQNAAYYTEEGEMVSSFGNDLYNNIDAFKIDIVKKKNFEEREEQYNARHQEEIGQQRDKLVDQIIHSNRSESGNKILESLGLATKDENGEYQLQLDAMENLTQADINNIQALVDNGVLIKELTDEENKEIEELINNTDSNKELGEKITGLIDVLDEQGVVEKNEDGTISTTKSAEQINQTNAVKQETINALKDQITGTNLTKDSYKILESMGLAYEENGQSQLQLSALGNLNETELEQIQVMLDNGVLTEELTDVQREAINKQIESNQKTGQLIISTDLLKQAVQNLATTGINVKGVDWSEFTKRDSTDSDKEFNDKVFGKQYSDIWSSLGLDESIIDTTGFKVSDLSSTFRTSEAVLGQQQFEQYLSGTMKEEDLNEYGKKLLDTTSAQRLIDDNNAGRESPRKFTKEQLSETYQNNKSTIEDNALNKKSITGQVQALYDTQGASAVFQVAGIQTFENKVGDSKSLFDPVTKTATVTGVLTGNKTVNSTDEILFHLDYGNGQTEDRTGDIEMFNQWVEATDGDLQMKIMNSTLNDILATNKSIDDNTGAGSEAAQDAADAANAAASALSSSTNYNQAYLGAGQLITTSSALHNSSYLNGNTSSSADWDSTIQTMREIGGGIGFAYDSEGLSLAQSRSMSGGTDRYVSAIQTIDDSYTKRGGYNATFTFNGTTADFENSVTNSAMRLAEESGLKASVTTTIATTDVG